jgi:hypothetical protein
MLRMTHPGSFLMESIEDVAGSKIKSMTRMFEDPASTMFREQVERSLGLRDDTGGDRLAPKT